MDALPLILANLALALTLFAGALGAGANHPRPQLR
jgi:hypothetical protein